METNTSKKAIRVLLHDSMRQAIGALPLPKTSKKVDRLLDKSSKKLASEFAEIIRKSSRKKKKHTSAVEYVDGVLNGRGIKRVGQKG